MTTVADIYSVGKQLFRQIVEPCRFHLHDGAQGPADLIGVIARRIPRTGREVVQELLAVDDQDRSGHQRPSQHSVDHDRRGEKGHIKGAEVDIPPAEPLRLQGSVDVDLLTAVLRPGRAPYVPAQRAAGCLPTLRIQLLPLLGVQPAGNAAGIGKGIHHPLALFQIEPDHLAPLSRGTVCDDLPLTLLKHPSKALSISYPYIFTKNRDIFLYTLCGLLYNESSIVKYTMICHEGSIAHEHFD